MPQQLELSTMTKKRLKMSCCGQFKSLWHSHSGQSFLLLNVNCKPILNDFELSTNQLGCTNLLKKPVTEFWISNSKMFCKLAFEGLLLNPGNSPHDCNYSSVAYILFSNLVIILSHRIISSFHNLLLQGI